MPLPQLTSSDAGAAARDKINAAIAKASQVDGKQDEFNLAGLLQDVSQVVARTASNSDAIDTLEDDYLARGRFTGRPGDTPASFAVVSARSDMRGNGVSLPEVPAATILSDDSGSVVRLKGPMILGMRQPAAVEGGRVYRARFVVQRRTNPSDPSNDSVVLGIVWLDGSMGVLAPTNDATIVEDVRDLSTAFGRQERQVAFARSPSPDAQFRAPARARYARAYVQNYGLDGATDVEVLGIDDVTLATVLAPETANTVERVEALESQELGQRVGVLEAQVGTTNTATFNTKADAAAGIIPDTVKTVELRGIAQPGDGGDGLYVRIAGPAPPGSDSFVNDGATFTRVFITADILGALLLSLPTTLPSAPGRAWLNGRTLAVS